MSNVSYCQYKKITKHQAESLNGFKFNLIKSWKKSLKKQAKKNDWINAKYKVHPDKKLIIVEMNKRSKKTFEEIKNEGLPSFYRMGDWEFCEGYIRYDKEYAKHYYC